MDPDFSEDIKEFAGRLAEEDNVLVVSHHDADGIAACAILVDMFRRLERNVEFMVIKQLDSDTIRQINKDKIVVFSDMGSGQIEMLIKTFRKFYVIDHHTPIIKHENQINPHFYGFDGGRDVSGAGMAYFVAKSLGYTNMVDIAIVGAVGDMQDSSGELLTLNRIILSDGVERGAIKVKHDLRLFGRQSRPLVKVLTYASDPILPGLTGNSDACISFLNDLGIPLKDNDEWRRYVDLNADERRKLIEALYILLVNNGVSEFLINNMLGEVYTLLKEEKRTELRDAKEFATLLNACGRQDQPMIGVHVCLGDRGENLIRARSILQTHRGMLKEGIDYLVEVGVSREYDHFYYFDSSGRINENIIGVIAGMAYGARIIPPDKPILALADDRDNAEMKKVSARANWGLINRGIHLGNAMRSSSMVGGEGGGHDIAAGAKIPKNMQGAFLKLVDSIFEEQLKKGN